ncbi:MAG: sugar ABC transporter substrate-binding protein [Bacillota bacterium]
MAGWFRLCRLSLIAGILVLLVGLAAGVAAGATTLEVWIMETGNPEGAKAFFNTVNTEFEAAHPGVKVNLSWIPWLGAQQKFLTSVTGGIAPDVAELGTTWTPDYAYMGALEDLTERVKGLGYASEFVPALVESATLDSKLYGLPWYAGNRCMIYRKDWFEAAGIKEFPRTWTEFIEVAKKLTKDLDGDGKVDRFGFSVNGGSQHEFMPLIWMNGGEIAVKTDKGWRSNVDSPEAIEAIRFFTDLYLKHKVSPEGSITWSVLNSRKAFTTETLAVVIDLPLLVEKFQKDNPNLAGKIGVAPIPYSKRPASFTGGSNLVVFSQSKKKDLAWDYMKLLLEPKHQLAWAQLVKFFPARMSVLKDPSIAKDPVLSVYADNLKYGRTYPAIHQWGQVENTKILLKAVQEIMMGKKTVEQAMQELANSMNLLFGYQE